MAKDSEEATTKKTEEELKFRKRAASRRKRRLFWLFVMLVVAVLVTTTVWKSQQKAGQAPRTDRYQAVFLDNGQVFFGKLTGIGLEYVTIEEAYYRQSQELPDTATDEQKAAVKNNVSLAKVGAEVYGPESEVKIRSEQILFWQNLKPDSKVTKAIESAKQ